MGKGRVIVIDTDIREHNRKSVESHELISLHKEFTLEQPLWGFNESELNENLTHWSHLG